MLRLSSTSIGGDRKSIGNYDNLPRINVISYSDTLKVNSTTIEDEWSPFRDFVHPSEPSAMYIPAIDKHGTPLNVGERNSFYKSKPILSLETRDRFSNRIKNGPVPEIQINESFSDTFLSGEFSVIFGGESITLPHNVVQWIWQNY